MLRTPAPPTTARSRFSNSIWREAVAACGGCDGAGRLRGRATRRDAPAYDGAFAPSDLAVFFDCLRERGDAVVAAHRGGPSAGYAENAINTFANTLRDAPAFLEVDVRRTRDGALVLMHDETLERTTTGSGLLRDLTLEQAQALHLRDPYGRPTEARIPTLREALDWAAGRAVLELDVKRGVSYEDVAREVEAAGAMARVVFIVHSTDGAARLARVAPEAMMYVTVRHDGDLEALHRAGVDLSRVVAWLGAGSPDRRLVRALAARGVEARVGMFGDRHDFDARARMGAHIVAVDEVAAAVRDLDAHDGVDGYGALLCLRAVNEGDTY
jgi:glycerophosphoryl diester phosphodiesterase